MRSLERSLQLGLVVSLLVLMALFWWGGSLVARLLSEHYVYSRMETEAGSIVAALEFPELEIDAPRFSDAPLHPAYSAPMSGKYFSVLVDTSGEIASRSSWEQLFKFAALPPGSLERGELVGIAGEPLLFWSGGFARNGHEFTVSVAEDISPILERLRIFEMYFAFIALLLLFALLVVQHLIVRYSVQKLERVRGDINRLEHGQAVALSENVPAEVLPLVREFNRLLLLFDQRLKHSRNSVGNLAHSLKGPLHLLLRASEQDVDNARPEHASAEQRVQQLQNSEQIRQNAEQIRQLIESELKRARLAGRGTPGRLFDVHAEIPPLSGLLQQIYSDKDIVLDLQIPKQVHLSFDRQDMLELIGNLLDNAYKWAQHRVVFSVDESSSLTFPGTDGRQVRGVKIVIDDDGPGCSPETLQRLTHRGVRLDEAVSGHGLGLSIVNDIVDTYSGHLELGASNTLGGFRATVVLPVPESAAQLAGHAGADAENPRNTSSLAPVAVQPVPVSLRSMTGASALRRKSTAT